MILVECKKCADQTVVLINEGQFTPVPSKFIVKCEKGHAITVLIPKPAVTATVNFQSE